MAAPAEPRRLGARTLGYEDSFSGREPHTPPRSRYDPPVIQFHLDPGSGVATYLQIVQQVKEALRLGTIEVGDQLPTVREVVADLAINPNTVAKAYRSLESEGLVVARQGRGTFISSTLAPPSLRHHDALRAELELWLASAVRAGLEDESIRALISATLRQTRPLRVA